MFEEHEYLKAANEINNIDIEGFEFFTESKQDHVNCKIYRRYKQDSGLYDYKILGNLLDVSYERCKTVYMDLEYRKVWDSYVKDLYEFEKSGVKGIYWNVNYPFPLSNRDYTYISSLYELEVNGVPTTVVLARSHLVNDIPPKSGVVRVTDYIQSLTIQGDGNVGTKAYMYYFDNPDGMIPTWLINWAAKTGVPTFMTAMRQACLGYDDYLKKYKK
ncbi:phosphatidylcholine transfer protein-like [Actinia tenebrosa]|uniref:Phosphatidylcholine transfer protein n=1 Tax=Actinia tenebrosa TaxID=6105 RepID=A0A6P8I769_ACTTE|nr:phosphatidylcholine transfer protein-like [Actinia tenebrosa]